VTKANVEFASLKLIAMNKISVLTGRIVWHLHSVSQHDEKSPVRATARFLIALPQKIRHCRLKDHPLRRPFFAFFNDREFENVANTDETPAPTHG
jgi:hypothetical protein